MSHQNQVCFFKLEMVLLYYLKHCFSFQVDREHPLWTGHQKLVQLLKGRDARGEMILTQIRELEKNCVGDMEDVVKAFDDKSAARVAQIFQHMAEIEMNFYK